ncbi:Sequence-specific DNA binding transcription factor [Melia azedarach]|uniref:Sequence-specific DNA binding transcription factor n=1 Tax=Melia azedarach TaxID=155640 RepID=A0ACC1X1G2_MELAZ|nr:Sequence-specific DNA binding transcription factor [Melia azedarach]
MLLGLEMPLHPQPQPQSQPQQQQQQQQQNPQSSHIQNQTNPQNPHQYPQMVAAYSHQHDTQAHQSVKQHGYLFTPKPKQQLSPLSDEDELGLTPDDSAGDGKRKTSPSPWQRMKWTDSMVKLLILAVLYIGDEAGSEGNDKKKAGALLQKKGKWKSVSRAMMERGFYVSPQQCEDKFNDLNKRYKRVNEILGKGTACLVVENQSLLDTMDLSPKMKEEVKKLLNSKHLFFREMCAYHNTCGHGGSTSGATGTNHSPEVATDPSQAQHQQAQQRCLHSSENAQHGANLIRSETEGSKLVKVGSDEEDDVEDESDDEDDYDDEEEAVGNSRGQHNGHGQEDEDENEEKLSRKRSRNGRFLVHSVSPLMQQLSSEVVNVMQDGGKNGWEKKQWMKMKLLQLEEQQVTYQHQAFDLEKQRLKWVKFSSKKEREMERAKLENERRRLENQRMVLLVRQKELELLDHHNHHQQQHSSNKRSDPSSITG